MNNNKNILRLIISFIFLMMSNISFSNTLEKISYYSGKIDIKTNVITTKYTEEYNADLGILKLNFSKYDYDSKTIPNVITVNDEYIDSIVTETFNGSTDVIIYLQKNYDYSISRGIFGISIRIKKEVKKLKEKKTIVLDAGHGGHDPGANYDGFREKDLALAIVKELAKDLEEDYNVILTRDKDVYIPLTTRANIGNEANADLFISIHLNAAKNRSANGIETFYYTKNPSAYAKSIAEFENNFDKTNADIIEASQFIVEDIFYHFTQTTSANIANEVLNELLANIPLRRRGVYGANFAVLRGSKSPAILIELGFISNAEDRAQYSTKSGQEKAAAAIAKAVRKVL